MRIGIMQPYFFPYLGYFQLINAVDRFILFDDVQYIRHGWINRNRILKPVEGHQYISIVLAEHNRGTLIKNMRGKNGPEWKQRILRQMEHYKKSSPYYMDVLGLLTNCFALEESNITRLNGHYLKLVCDYIGIGFRVEISSEMNMDYSEVQDAGEWALKISEQLGADCYINPSGGTELFDKIKFEKSNIKLSFLQAGLKEYNQFRNVFEPGLSIVDVMMFNSPAAIRVMLNDFHLS